MELCAGILFIFLFFINIKEIPPIMVLLALCLPSFAAYMILMMKIPSKAKYVYFIVIFPLLLIAGNISGFPLFTLALLGLFIYWRGTVLYEEDMVQYNHALLLLLAFLFGVAAIIYSALSDYPYQSFLLYFLILQLIIILIGGFLNKWMTITNDKAKFVLYFVKLLSIMAGAGLAVTFLYKVIKMGFFGILESAAWLFSSLVVPIFGLIQFLMNLIKQDDYKFDPEPAEFQGGAGEYTADHTFFITEEWLTFFFMIVVTIVIFFLIKTKLKNSGHMGVSPYTVEILQGTNLSSTSARRRKKGNAPEDLIRKEIFELEKYADKLRLGRLPYETLGEWWERVGLTGSEKSKNIYQKVRYGEEVSSSEDQAIMKEEILNLKQQLKELDKMDKNRRKLLRKK